MFLVWGRERLLRPHIQNGDTYSIWHTEYNSCTGLPRRVFIACSLIKLWTLFRYKPRFTELMLSLTVSVRFLKSSPIIVVVFTERIHNRSSEIRDATFAYRVRRPVSRKVWSFVHTWAAWLRKNQPTSRQNFHLNIYKTARLTERRTLYFYRTDQVFYEPCLQITSIKSFHEKALSPLIYRTLLSQNTNKRKSLTIYPNI